MDLTDEEKERFIQAASQYIIPIAAKYELDDTNGRAALIEAFQAGVKFFYEQTKQRSHHGGTPQSQDDAVVGQ